MRSLLSITILALGTVQADPILDFETDTHGNPTVAATDVAGTYASLGVTFTSEDPTDATTPTFGNFSGNIPGMGVIDFMKPILPNYDAYSFNVTAVFDFDVTSVTVDTYAGDHTSAFMFALDAADNLLASVHTGPTDLAGPNHLFAGPLSVSGVGNIRKIVWKADASNSGIGIDNLRLNDNIPSVPEPSGLAFFALGAVLLGAHLLVFRKTG